jgi:hypothetical protein
MGKVLSFKTGQVIQDTRTASLTGRPQTPDEAEAREFQDPRFHAPRVIAFSPDDTGALETVLYQIALGSYDLVYREVYYDEQGEAHWRSGSTQKIRRLYRHPDMVRTMPFHDAFPGAEPYKVEQRELGLESGTAANR